MQHWWWVIGGVVAGVLLLWLMLAALLWQSAVEQPRIRDLLRLVPDLLGLLRRLAGDRLLPFAVRLRVWLLIAYLASPIDVVPDFIPVIGYADDAILVAVTLRSVVRRAGPVALERHWRGTADGLAAVRSFAGLS